MKLISHIQRGEVKQKERIFISNGSFLFFLDDRTLQSRVGEDSNLFYSRIPPCELSCVIKPERKGSAWERPAQRNKEESVGQRKGLGRRWSGPMPRRPAPRGVSQASAAECEEGNQTEALEPKRVRESEPAEMSSWPRCQDLEPLPHTLMSSDSRAHAETSSSSRLAKRFYWVGEPRLWCYLGPETFL